MSNPAPLFSAGPTPPPFVAAMDHLQRRSQTTAGLGNCLCLFFVFLSVYWVSLYTFNPTFVQAPLSIRKYAILGNTSPPDDQTLVALPDVGRCYIAAIVLALATVALLKLLGAC